MKAIITDRLLDSSFFDVRLEDPCDPRLVNLGLRLVPEGCNDRLLLRMLERQYPSILRPDCDGSVYVPIYEGIDSGEISELKVETTAQTTQVGDHGWTVYARYDSRGATIRHGMLLPEEGTDGSVAFLKINGRSQPRRDDGTFQIEDIVAGAFLEFCVSPHYDQVRQAWRIVSGDAPKPSA